MLNKIIVLENEIRSQLLEGGLHLNALQKIKRRLSKLDQTSEVIPNLGQSSFMALLEELGDPLSSDEKKVVRMIACK